MFLLPAPPLRLCLPYLGTSIKKECRVCGSYFSPRKWQRLCDTCTTQSSVKPQARSASIQLPDGKKQCPKCKIVFDATSRFFFRHAKNKDGLNVWCKKCQTDQARQSRGSVKQIIEKDGKRKCSSCNKWKEPSGFESSNTFDGLTRLCHQCLEHHRFIASIPVGHQWCRKCNRVMPSIKFHSSQSRLCKVCKKTSIRESMRAANRKFYVNRKQKHSLTGSDYDHFNLATQNQLRNTMTYHEAKFMNVFICPNWVTGMDAKTLYEKRLERFRDNILAVIKDSPPIPEHVVRMGMERIKGLNNSQIADNLNLSKDYVERELRVIQGASNNSDKKQHVGAKWAQPFIGPNPVNLFDGIRLVKNRGITTIWSTEDLAIIEEMFRNGKTASEILAIFKRGETRVFRRHVHNLYLKFAKMLHTRRIKLDWYPKGSNRKNRESKIYLENRDEAIRKAQKTLGLHPQTLISIQRVAKKYNRASC